MRKKSKLVHGVGVNDSPNPVTIHEGPKGNQVIVWRCPMYSTWSHMIKRCYDQKYHSKQPTYIDCSVEHSWFLFSNFSKWMSTQEWEGKCLDKDILVPGNKVYSAKTCIFVSRALNNFLEDSGATRGRWPIGVSFDEKRKKFHSYCRNPFSMKRETLGFFDCPQEAHAAWKRRKHQHALRYACMQVDSRVAEALRKRFST